MTAKTHGYITKEIELEQIYQFVLKYFDPEAKVNRYENRFGESNEMAVYFTYKGEERRLFTMVYKSRKFSKNGEEQTGFPGFGLLGAQRGNYAFHSVLFQRLAG